ncbi:hypothetical protein A3B21_02460 [Candidatus Uhrbacteria bacterium RIFCSPLOWO2_01_FULL_47_24]|uniref:HNH domain-containing protein n=1 Tax=Candidatus Uhrbacteria bacterium RIFCSPLOWO2_01_FULL_47_24 TaxID=1802401 RepID=A0A1F7UQN5_9BACT|nr:MAG: hypothetical protein A2753_02380 [Candidatus Uhrbacteria bacterium RIFCSPHIGHO2_01_FULL_47_11]OGL68270.1 MAG: hypothetical protein A3D58_04680 [Candidatus Uhrbacteria bacterium RIFCSPHIGHO2_02_FULL_46_47]OGL76999.1 MAG: hypothetical protein A3F52_02535 [Candidatus Uhrbacteria bacterium RIFCSPHIGHO2_12_FULL_47_11]OGL80008.1 MAG: hypothetical protein A3B21_02460 [Candidatus Uhrbacteria bacterium RIFCSPLOWO2_01_FULL_47_24]OGL85206.1 MAG: hypothetical protein A3J03_00050 [Candidatus Uhrbact
MNCACCKRLCMDITKHHLIPRTRHNNKRIKKCFTPAQLNTTVDLCRSCHRQVHALFTEKELERSYFTLELLVAHPAMLNFINWIKTKSADMRPRVKRSY